MKDFNVGDELFYLDNYDKSIQFKTKISKGIVLQKYNVHFRFSENKNIWHRQVSDSLEGIKEIWKKELAVKIDRLSLKILEKENELQKLKSERIDLDYQLDNLLEDL